MALDMKHGSTEQKRFEAYLAMDPRIGELLKDAQAATESQPFCANRVWYRKGGLRRRVKELVGYGRPEGPNELRTSNAYEAVYRTVYRALRDCDHGDCLCGLPTALVERELDRESA
jgi:hypothetical protein